MNHLEKTLKRYLKKKVRITESMLVLFLITGGISYGAFTPPTSDAFLMEEITDSTKPYLTEFTLDSTEYGVLLKGIEDFTFTTDNVEKLINNYLNGKTSTGGTANPYKIVVGSIDDNTFEINVDGSTLYYKITNGSNNTAITNPSGTRLDNPTEDIKENFYNLSFEGDGGAIYNMYNVKNINITGDFINNSATSEYSYGGAIYNYGSTIDKLNGNFINNSSTNSGGAIYNDGSTINTLEGNFINNSSQFGGAIYNYGSTIDKLNGNFINNSSTNSGGAVVNYNSSTINTLEGDFINNSSKYGGAIRNEWNSTIGQLNSNFINNSGGAVYNSDSSHIDTIVGSFINNSSSINGGGGIYNQTSTIGTITGDFINNSSSNDGGAIYNDATYGKPDTAVIESIKGNFIGNTAFSGGAIYNDGIIESLSGNFINNSGYAVYNQYGTITLVADDSDMIFAGNTDGDIYNSGGTINMMIANDKSIIFNSDVSDNSYGSFNIGDATNNGTVIFNHSANLGNLDFINGTIQMGSSGYLRFNSLTLGEVGSTNDLNLYLAGNSAQEFDASSWTVNTSGILNTKLDIDLSDFTADSFINVPENLKVNILAFNILNPVEWVEDQKIQITDGGQFTIDSEAFIPEVSEEILPPDTILRATTPLINYEYLINADNLSVDGYITVTGGVPGKRPSSFNSSALATPVARGAYANNLNDINKSTVNRNNNFILDTHETFNRNIWVDISQFKNDLKYDTLTVDNEVYSAIVGSDLSNKYSFYGGYISSSQKYSNVETNQDSLVLGGKMNLQKNNFFFSLGGNIGTSLADASTEYGKDDFEMYSASIMGKVWTRYDITDKIYLEPALYLGLGYIHSSSYTNAGGVHLDSSNGIFTNISPEFKIGADFDSSFAPYMSIGYNLSDAHDSSIDGTYNGTTLGLPNFSVDNYPEFKVGVEKTFSDTFSGHVEGVVRTEDRDGYGVQLGFEWKI